METVREVIREAVTEDVAAMARLLDELGYPTRAQQVAGRFKRLQADPDTRVFVAVFDGQVVGLAAAHIMQPLEHDEPWCELIALVVTKAQRGKGIGRSLVAAVESEARARRCGGMVLGSGAWRPDAHTFYGQLGYKETGTRFKKRLIGNSKPEDSREGT
jgi:GNAT superfamily N-acetyltransferase